MITRFKTMINYHIYINKLEILIDYVLVINTGF
jgi:hypothetical protein